LLAALILVSGAAAAKQRSEQASVAAYDDVLEFSDWSTPVELGRPVNTAAEESAPSLSDDGRSLYFNRNPNLPEDNDEDIYVSQRGGPHEEWGDPAPVVAINTPAFHERNATLSRDGRLLFFSSSRPGGFGGLDLYVSQRVNRRDDQGWSTPVNLGPTVNSTAADVGPAYVEDEAGSTVLYFTSNRPAPAGFGAADIYVSRRRADGSFGSAVLVPELSSPSGDARPAIRTDGLELLLHSNRSGAPSSCPVDTPTPSGGQDLWVSTRATAAATWSCPVNLGPEINSASNDLQAALSDDGEVLLFSSNRPGGSGSDDIWMSKRDKLEARGRGFTDRQVNRGPRACGVNRAVVNSLDARLQAIQSALGAANAGDKATACDKPEAFVNEVQAPDRVGGSSPDCPSASTLPSRRCSRSIGRFGCCGLVC